MIGLVPEAIEMVLHEEECARCHRVNEAATRALRAGYLHDSDETPAWVRNDLCAVGAEITERGMAHLRRIERSELN